MAFHDLVLARVTSLELHLPHETRSFWQDRRSRRSGYVVSTLLEQLMKRRGSNLPERVIGDRNVIQRRL